MELRLKRTRRSELNFPFFFCQPQMAWIQRRQRDFYEPLLSAMAQIRPSLFINALNDKVRGLKVCLPWWLLAIQKNHLKLIAPKSHDYCDLQVRLPSQTPEVARFRKQDNFRVRWKIAGDWDFERRLPSPKPVLSAGLLAIWLWWCQIAQSWGASWLCESLWNSITEARVRPGFPA